MKVQNVLIPKVLFYLINSLQPLGLCPQNKTKTYIYIHTYVIHLFTENVQCGP